jgi:hypothetical protein
MPVPVTVVTGAADTEARAITGVEPDGEVRAGDGVTDAVPVTWLAGGGTVAVPVTAEREVAEELSDSDDDEDEDEDDPDDADEVNIGEVRTVVSAGLSSLAQGDGGVLGVLIGTGAGGGPDVTGGVDDFGVKSEPVPAANAPADAAEEEDGASYEGAADSAAPALGVLDDLSGLSETVTVERSEVPVGDSVASCSAAARVSTGASSASVEAPAAPDLACVSVIDQSCPSEVVPGRPGPTLPALRARPRSVQWRRASRHQAGPSA